MSYNHSTAPLACYEIPPEVSDYIIDHIWDKATLANCSLVCRSWANRSRHRLFHTVDISIKRCSKLEDFIAFLLSSPHLTSSIRNLALRGTIADDRLSYAAWFYISAEILLACLDKLPNVAELSLYGVRLTGGMKAEGRIMSSAVRHQDRPVKTLLLSYVFADPDVLFQTLHYFPTLRHLSAEAIYWTSEYEHANDACTIPITPLTLEYMNVGGGSSYNMAAQFFPRVQRNFDVTCLRSLTLHFDQLNDSPETSQFMDCAGSRLECLHIIIGKRARVTDSDRFIDSLRLDQCTALLEFGFDMEATFSRSKDPSLVWSLLSSLVAKLSRTVRRLTVTHRLDHETLRVGLRDWNWTTLDALLSDKCLSRVTIRSPLNASGTKTSAKCIRRTVVGGSIDNMKLLEVFFRTSLPILAGAHILSVESY